MRIEKLYYKIWKFKYHYGDARHEENETHSINYTYKRDWITKIVRAVFLQITYKGKVSIW